MAALIFYTTEEIFLDSLFQLLRTAAAVGNDFVNWYVPIETDQGHRT